MDSQILSKINRLTKTRDAAVNVLDRVGKIEGMKKTPLTPVITAGFMGQVIKFEGSEAENKLLQAFKEYFASISKDSNLEIQELINA